MQWRLAEGSRAPLGAALTFGSSIQYNFLSAVGAYSTSVLGSRFQYSVGWIHFRRPGSHLATYLKIGWWMSQCSAEFWYLQKVHARVKLQSVASGFGMELTALDKVNSLAVSTTAA